MAFVFTLSVLFCPLAGAGNLKQISACDTNLTIKQIGFSRVAHTSLSPEELAHGVTKEGDDLVSLGSILGGIYINLLTLEVTPSADSYRKPLEGPSRLQAKHRKFHVLKTSPSGHLSVLSELKDRAPITLMRDEQIDSAIPLTVRGKQIEGIFSRAINVAFNQDETLLALSKYDKAVHVIDPKSGEEKVSLELGTVGLDIDWSQSEVSTLFILPWFINRLQILKYNPGTSELRMLVEMKGSFANAPSMLYVPQKKELVVLAAKRIFAIDEDTGNGTYLEFRLRTRGFSTSPDGNFLLVYTAATVLVCPSESLARCTPIPLNMDDGARVSFATFNSKSQAAVIQSDGKLDLFEIAI